MSWKWLTDLLPKILVPFFSLVTPEIKSEIENFIKGLYQKATQTTSPWDDFFVKFLADVLGIDVTK